MVSFEGPSTPSWNFFENDFMTQLPPHLNDDCGPESIAKYNRLASRFIFQNGNKELSEVDEDGDDVANPRMPFFVRFRPSAGLPESDGNSRFFDQLNAEGTNPIPADATLFDVMALDEPNGTNQPWDTPQNESKIGEIVLRGQFHQSLWGDEKLFFTH